MNSALPRITARIDIDVQALLSQAAAIVGIPSINAFVLNAAIEKAKLIIEKEHILKLSQRDAMLLAEALDSPAKAHPRLQQAAKRYREKSTT
jgi:uncharacterized protein (DUF1778 family)